MCIGRRWRVTVSTDLLIEQTLSLPAELRAFLAERLIESLDGQDSGELSPEWKEEIQLRCRELDRNVAVLRDADAVFRDAFSALE